MDPLGHEKQQKIDQKEIAKIQVKDLLTSRFGLAEETVVLPSELKYEPSAKEDLSDIMFRDEVTRVLPSILSQPGNVLIIQNIATQHAVATTPVFLEAGLDTYFTFIPENKTIRPSFMQGSYYHPERVISVALANEERIKQAKDKLEREQIRGIVVSFDIHARYEDENGELDRFFPSEDRLRNLGINRIVLMGEFAPLAAQGLTDRRINRKEDWDKSHIYGYLRSMSSKGYFVSLIGIYTKSKQSNWV